MKCLPGVDMSTGSLGQGLSPGLGMALGGRKLGLGFRTYVMVGDGEIQEGQIWEACFVAGTRSIRSPRSSITTGCRSLAGPTRQDSQGRAIRSPQKKFRAFGWNTVECDRCDHGSIESAIEEAKACTGVPTVIIAHTIKGKGVSFMEGDFNWHAKVPTQSSSMPLLTS